MRPKPTLVSLLVAGCLVGAGAAGGMVVKNMPPDSTSARAGTPVAGTATSYMLGALLLEQGEIGEALPYLAYAHRNAPGSLLIGRTYRDALGRAGYLDEALEVSEGIVTLPGAGFDDWGQLVRLQVRRGHLERARGALATMAESYPDSTVVLLWQGDLLARQGDPSAAADAYRAFATREPQRASLAAGALARLAASVPADALARRFWDQALALSPQDTGLHLRMLQDLVERGDDTEALARAADLDSLGTVSLPEGSWLGMAGMLLARAGRTGGLEPLLRRRLDAGRLPADACELLARLLLQREAWDEAQDVLARAVALWPDTPSLLRLQAQVLITRDDLPAAERAARRAAALAPRDIETQTLLLSILNRKHEEIFRLQGAVPDSGARDELLPVARRAAALADSTTDPHTAMLLGATLQALGEHVACLPLYRLAARDSSLRRDARLNISDALEQAGRVDEALQTLEEILARHPDDPTVLNSLGYMLADHGRDLARAERLIRRALAAEPDNPAYLDSLGWVLYRRDDLAGAFDHLVEAINGAPDDPVILEHMARVLWDRGQRERALEILDRALATGGDPATLNPLRRRWERSER